MPLFTLGIITIYYYLKKKKTLFVIFAIMLLLIKETAALLLFAVFLHYFIKKYVETKKIQIKDIKKSWYLIILLIPLFLWFIYLKFTFGWAFRTNLFYNKNIFLSTLKKNIIGHFLIDNTLDNVNKFNFFISFFILLSFPKLKGKKIKLTYFLFSIILVFYFLLFSFSDDLPRYFTPILPFFYILGSYSINKITKKFKKSEVYFYLTIMILIILFITNYQGYRQAQGWQLKSNLEYLDMITTHKKAIQYLQHNFVNSTIITCFPMTFELKNERFGYISKKLVVSVDYNITEKNIGSIIYHSPQSSTPFFMNRFNNRKLKLVKSFEKNKNVAEIYEIIG